jgi:hypothetical protein
LFRTPSFLTLAALALLGAAPESRAGGDGHGHPNHAAVFIGATVHDSHVYPTVNIIQRT